MQKIRLNLDALALESFAVSPDAERGHGTVDAHEAGPTRNCNTPDCTVTCP